MIVAVLIMSLNVEAAVKINKNNVTLIKGQTVRLKVIGTKQKVKWSSSKKNVANVAQTGLVRARAKGIAVIKAKVGKKTYSCKIKVETPKINKTKATVTVGKTLQLKVIGNTQTVKWTSNNKSVATVTNKGVVKARKIGSATITATIAKKKYTCRVTVKKASIPVTYFYLNNKSIKVKLGSTETISHRYYPNNATNAKVTYTSSDPSVATVNAKGGIKGISLGETIITASCGGYTDTCAVEVISDFDSQQAIGKLTYTSYRVREGVITIVKNNYKYDIDLSLDCLYYNVYGTLIGKGSDNCYCLESGRECALFTHNPYNSDYEDVDYDHYQIVFSVDEISSNILRNGNGITYGSNFGQDNVMVTVTNAGSETRSTAIAIVFYLNGKPVAYDYKYAEVDHVGSSAYLDFSFPYDENYETIYPTSYKVFVRHSYMYSWES